MKNNLIKNIFYLIIILLFSSCTTRVNYKFTNKLNYPKDNWENYDTYPKKFSEGDYLFSNIISHKLYNGHETKLNPLDTNYLFNNVYLYFNDYGYEKDYKIYGYRNYIEYRKVNKFDTSLTIYDDYYIMEVMIKLNQLMDLDTNNIQNIQLTKIYVNDDIKPINKNTKKELVLWKTKISDRSYKLLDLTKGKTLSFEDTLFCNLRKVDSLRIEFEPLLIDGKYYTIETLKLQKVFSESKGIDFLREPLPTLTKKEFEDKILEQEEIKKHRTAKRKSKLP